MNDTDTPILAVPPPASLPTQADHSVLRANPPAILTIKEAAVVATVSRRKICELISAGKLKVTRMGRRVVIPRTNLEKTMGCKLS